MVVIHRPSTNLRVDRGVMLIEEPNSAATDSATSTPLIVSTESTGGTYVEPKIIRLVSSSTVIFDNENFLKVIAENP